METVDRTNTHLGSLWKFKSNKAAEYFSNCTLTSSKEVMAVVEGRDTTGGKVKDQGTRTVLLITLADTEAETSINVAMLQEVTLRVDYTVPLSEENLAQCF